MLLRFSPLPFRPRPAALVCQTHGAFPRQKTSFGQADHGAAGAVLGKTIFFLDERSQYVYENKRSLEHKCVKTNPELTVKSDDFGEICSPFGCKLPAKGEISDGV